MSRRVVIDSLAFASEGGSLQGELQVVLLTRLLDLLTDSTGSLVYRVAGRIGQRNRPELLVEVDGVLSLRCQRCLEALEYPLELRSLLEFVDSDGDLTQEELEDDSRDFLPLQKELDVAGLIEDEILLALPIVPRHADCVLPGAVREEAASSPFLVLAGLKGRH
ncbi:MAG: DUF177 domain-containing protein [Candidatus Accumulibacter sp.]|jgi:uncharacterized protein|uniref:Large ribosomal RNA subunit accumulation protein YceD n=1 Tax=Accumulibacter regalis TaxID=522306 RepID=C7RTM2_ACCRE|nr:DUF177 domain-containing protein [Accumulibacter sp.]MBO3714793.1 DUF177 domain-containing protein [Accumulibacter sp.]